MAKKIFQHPSVPLIGVKPQLSEQMGSQIQIGFHVQKDLGRAVLTIDPPSSTIGMDLMGFLRVASDMRARLIAALTETHPHVSYWGQWVISDNNKIFPDPCTHKTAGENIVFRTKDDALSCGQTKWGGTPGFWIGRLSEPPVPVREDYEIMQSMIAALETLPRTAHEGTLLQSEDSERIDLNIAINSTIMQALALTKLWPPKFSVISDVQFVSCTERSIDVPRIDAASEGSA